MTLRCDVENSTSRTSFVFNKYVILAASLFLLSHFHTFDTIDQVRALSAVLRAWVPQGGLWLALQTAHRHVRMIDARINWSILFSFDDVDESDNDRWWLHWIVWFLSMCWTQCLYCWPLVFSGLQDGVAILWWVVFPKNTQRSVFFFYKQMFLGVVIDIDLYWVMKHCFVWPSSSRWIVDR